MTRTHWGRGAALCASVSLAAALLPLTGTPAQSSPSATAPAAVVPAVAAGAPLTGAGPITSEALTTWDHEKSAATTGHVDGDTVRRSTVYSASVATGADPDVTHSSFVYMSVPRSGEGKIGYDEQDGAEFSAGAGLTMSWTSFEYSQDVWVDVHLETGGTLTSPDQVTIRPTDLGLEKQVVDASTIRVKVPHRDSGYRFSVEFDSELYTAYNDLSGDSGALTTRAEGNRAVHTEPKDSMMVFANASLGAQDTERYVPTEADGSIHRVEPGKVSGLEDVDAEILYFGPGTYYMGSDQHALLPENVRWVYLAPGAYVKGAFRFLHETQEHFKVTGLGVLSGEQYVYEPDTTQGYQHTTHDNCHTTCVKMLQFESSNQGQTLDLQGVTVNQPPYHSFVVYAHEDGTEVEVENFTMDVENYKQVGSWYWQTDGIELYPDSTMSDTFFHANDDVLKLYHSNVSIKDTVIWKNENGPVFQWGWTPREVHDVQVSGTDIIHNRMYWKDVKYNTCVFNSSTHWEDMNATDRADTSTTVRDIHFSDTRVEGMVNCAIRVYAMSDTSGIVIDGFSVDSWNDLDPQSQVSQLKLMHDRQGNTVSLGDPQSSTLGISLHNYTVGGVPVLKAGDNWASDELGRLDFDGEAWEGWDATADGQPTGTAPTLEVQGPEDGSTAASRHVEFAGTTDAASLAVTVNGQRREVPLHDGRFSTTVDLPAITNRVTLSATGDNGVMTVLRRTVTALGTRVGSLTDPTGDDNGPGSYTYPTDSAFNAGSFDLTGMDVYEDGELIRFVTTTAGAVNNPWGGNGMSTQRLNIYLREGDSTTTTALLPGTNTSAEGAWSRVVVADGRYAEARLGGGVYDADLERVGDVSLEVHPSGTIIASVPATALADVDLEHAGYQVSMYSDAEEGEGVGNVRPVYSAECAAGGSGCPSFVGPYRVGGGAGEFSDSLDSRDTDTTDSNALDIISGDAAQAVVMDWTRGAVVVPYVALTPAGTPGGDDQGQSGDNDGDHGQSGDNGGDHGQSGDNDGDHGQSGDNDGDTHGSDHGSTVPDNGKGTGVGSGDASASTHLADTGMALGGFLLMAVTVLAAAGLGVRRLGRTRS